MACNKPIRAWRTGVFNPETGKQGITLKFNEGLPHTEFSLPCYNKCNACLKKRAQEWAVRCFCEMKQHERASFLTFGYAPKWLPKNRSLHSRDLQLFWKRYRKWLDETSGTKIRYLACGEYGEKNGRPHYHALVFGHEFQDQEFREYSKGNSAMPLYTSTTLHRLWPYGYNTIGEANFTTAQYVAKYVAKADYTLTTREKYAKLNKIPPFIRVSREPPIGVGWLEKYHGDLYPEDCMTIDGFRYPLPRAFDNWMDKKDPDMMAQVRKKRIQRAYKRQKTHPEEFNQLRLDQKDEYIRVVSKNQERWI